MGIYPVQQNTTIDKNDPNLVKNKILIVSSNQINQELNNNQQTNPRISNPVPSFNQLAKSGSMIDAACNTTSNSEKSDDRLTSKNEIAKMIATMIQPMQEQIKMLTDKVAVLENVGD